MMEIVSPYFWVLKIGIVVCLVALLFRWKRYVAQRVTKSSFPLDSFSLGFLDKIVNALILLVALLTILRILGLDIAPFVTFGGVGVAALGFSAKEMIANYIAGLMLYVTRPFSIGDLIEIPEKKISGTILEIGWYLTTILDGQKRKIAIPNTLFTSTLLINASRMTHRCFQETFSLRLSDARKAPSILEKTRLLLMRHPLIDRREPLYTYVKSYGTYSLEIELKAYFQPVSLEEFLRIKQSILLSVYEFIREESADLAYPLFDRQTDYSILR